VGQTFLQQRFYPTLRLGLSVTVARRRGDATLHCRQGDWDGACGLHCAAMALTLLGRLSSVTTLSAPRKGIAARLWQAAAGMYFDGMSGEKMTLMLKSLHTGLRIKHFGGTHRQTLAFTQAQLRGGAVAIVGLQDRDKSIDHWVLGVGMEGMQRGRSFTPQTLLVLDPSLPEPEMCGYNGRLEFAQSRLYVTYLANDGTELLVKLIEAVAIKDAA
jgi:hypothetical protein